MPPSARSQSAPKDLVICPCRFCERTNSEPKERVSKSTRRNHMLDQRNEDRAIAAQSSTAQSSAHSEWITSISGELELLANTPIVHPKSNLVFVKEPTPLVPFYVDVDEEIRHPNSNAFSLANHRFNRQFLNVTLRLSELHHLLQSLNMTEVHDDLIGEIKSIMGKLLLEKHIQWNNQQTPGTSSNHVNTEIFFYKGRPRSKAYRCAVLVSLVLRYIYSVPVRGIRTQLSGIRSLLRAANLPDDEIRHLPQHAQTTTAYYRLQPITRQYVCCPSCNSLYMWNGQPPSDAEGSVPRRCSRRRALEDPDCDAEMWKTRQLPGNRTILVPLKPYKHQPLKYWLGRLLSRPDIEDHLDKARSHAPSTGEILDDIWGSPCLQSLQTADNQPFLPGPPDEGRLIFGLAMDSFNPNYVKAAHQSISSTPIWLVLLNLPVHLRYLHENMYVASVIPGPHKPSLEEINNFLDLVVDDLLEIYSPGLHFSKTFKYKLGRLYKAMLVPLICDMLAARQATGQAASPSAHNFCTACDLDQDDIDTMDPKQWPPKEIIHIRRYAELWKSATTAEARKKLFNSSGFRWSSLLRISYWDPVKFTVIDAMHTLDLGLFSNHVRSLFALKADAKGGDGACPPQPPVNKRIYTKAHVTGYNKCLKIVTQNSASLEQELSELDRRVLYTFSVDNDIRDGGRNVVVGTKGVLIRSIIKWRGSAAYVAPNKNIPELLNETATRQSEEPDREATPDAAVDKTLLPAMKLLLSPTAENLGKLSRAATKKTFIQISQMLEVDISHISMGRRSAKQELQDLILETIANDDSLLERLTGFLPQDSNRVVLGQEIMQIVWADMKKTQTPNWVATAPPNWGTTERGKLSAAQWRVICTIHLPITLIRLWANEVGRKRTMLDHFMDLVCAVRLANMKICSPDQVEAYEMHMFRYVSNISRIYPDQKLKPTHHCALHIGQFIKFMGPTHSHNSPFFERYINFFHHQNTNSHPGELESTLLNSTACSANLRALLADDSTITPLVCEMVDTMKTIDREDIRGFRLASILNPNSPTGTSELTGSPLKLNHSRQLLWRKCLELRGESDVDLDSPVLSFPQIALQGVCYSTTNHIHRNSVILFSEISHQAPSPHISGNQSLKAAFIELIFHSEAPVLATTFYLVVRELVPVVETDRDVDPYKRYGFAGGFLCRLDHQVLRVIHLDQVKSHATLTRLEMGRLGAVYHVLSVDRMMNIFTTFEYDIPVSI